jgi:hypothetical protein
MELMILTRAFFSSSSNWLISIHHQNHDKNKCRRDGSGKALSRNRFFLSIETSSVEKRKICTFRLTTFFEKIPCTWTLRSQRPDVKMGFTGTPIASIIH